MTQATSSLGVDLAVMALAIRYIKISKRRKKSKRCKSQTMVDAWAEVGLGAFRSGVDELAWQPGTRSGHHSALLLRY